MKMNLLFPISALMLFSTLALADAEGTTSDQNQLVYENLAVPEATVPSVPDFSDFKKQVGSLTCTRSIFNKSAVPHPVSYSCQLEQGAGSDQSQLVYENLDVPEVTVPSVPDFSDFKKQVGSLTCTRSIFNKSAVPHPVSYSCQIEDVGQQ